MQASVIDSSAATASNTIEWLPALTLNGREPQLMAWAEANRELLTTYLRTTGAVLLRGVKLNGSARWQRLIEALFNEPLLTYKNCSTPRTQLKGNIYTSTEYPPEEFIPLHNENAYSHEWALRLAFMCVLPATSGGCTPIADSRRIYQRMPDAIRARFERLGVMYVRNYGAVDLAWQQVFQTDDPAQVNAYCQEHAIDYQWHADGGLTTREIRQGVATHPLSGEAVWFNQAHLFHLSSCRPEVQASLLQTFGEARLPRHAYYGDGSPITAADLDQIRQLYSEEALRFDWQMGDVLLLDNMLCAHGRDPFEGPRKLLVGMAAAHAGGEFTPQPA